MQTDPIASAWLTAMWRACWQGTVAIVLVWVLCRMLKKSSPTLRAGLWWLACLKCLAGLVLTATVALPLLTPAPVAKFQSRLEQLGALVRPERMRLSFDPDPEPPHAPHAASRVYNPDAQAFRGKVELVMEMWALGVLMFAGWMGWEVVRLRSVLKNSTSLDDSPMGEAARLMGAHLGLDAMPRVVESDQVTAPMVVGFWRATVVLPAGFGSGFSEEERRMALAHELAHVRRRDMIAGLVPSLCQLVFFFLPPVWLALREWSLEREAACDAEAIEAAKGTPAGYGQMLLKIVTKDHKGRLAPALGATSSYHTLRKRLEMIKSFAQPSRRSRLLTLTFAALALLLVVPWQVTARASESPKDDHNLVVNGGFENGMADWMEATLLGTDTGVTTSVDGSTAHSGSSSLEFQKTRPSYAPVQVLSQLLPFDSSKTKIQVSFWAKAQNVGKCAMAVLFSGANDTGIQWGAYVGVAKDGDSPATHDWKKYGSVLAIPPGTRAITVALEMYGPGTVWLDDVSAEYVPDSTPLQPATKMEGESDPLADVKDVPNQEVSIGNDPMEKYFLIGPKPGAGKGPYKLLVVMPGGDGSADFNPFVRRIWKFGLPQDYIVAELVAPKWSLDQFNQIVWPTNIVRFTGMKFSTEDFIAAVVKDVSRRYSIDADKVFSLSWSSGGPAGYAEGLSHGPVKGTVIMSSIFHPNTLPPLVAGTGRPFYILHSPTDEMIPLAQAQEAAEELQKAGAKTKLVTFEGGHGVGAHVYDMLQTGIQWLEQESR